jgi:transcriptional regulator with XRE-family HTH domain/KaiC/GvpD/RAD55 family RecA-like ATPase
LATISAGIPELDRFLGGYQPGDNVVWAAEAGTFVHTFVAAFIKEVADDAESTVVYVNSNYAPQSIFRRFTNTVSGSRFVHVDAFTYGKGKGDDLFRSHYENASLPVNFENVCLEDPSDPAQFHDDLSAVEEKYGEGSKYVFDSLTGLSELWGGDRDVQRFFTHHCPKLYELQAVAYWALEKEAHPGPFLANLTHITQVVIQLRNMEEGFFEMKFQKAEDRPSRILHDVLRYQVADETIQFLDRIPGRELRAGDRIKEYRVGKNLSQAELARMLDITPSALCQIENNQVHPSLPVLLDLSQTLGCSLDDFFGHETLARGKPDGWLVHKKKDQTVAKTGKKAAKVEIQSLLPGEGKTKRVTPYLLRLAVGAEDTRPFFDHKGPEFGWILGGLLKITVEQEEIVLRKGDSIYLEDQTLNRWRNEGTGRVELVWVLC